MRNQGNADLHSRLNNYARRPSLDGRALFYRVPPACVDRGLSNGNEGSKT